MLLILLTDAVHLLYYQLSYIYHTSQCRLRKNMWRSSGIGRPIIIGPLPKKSIGVGRYSKNLHGLHQLMGLFLLLIDGWLNPRRRTGTIAWTNCFHGPPRGRLVKDYEYTVTSSVSWLYLANIQILLQRKIIFY